MFEQFDSRLNAKELSLDIENAKRYYLANAC